MAPKLMKIQLDSVFFLINWLDTALHYYLEQKPYFEDNRDKEAKRYGNSSSIIPYNNVMNTDFSLS